MQAMMAANRRARSAKAKNRDCLCPWPIVTAKAKGGFMGGESMGSTTIIEALARRMKTKNVVAIVLRVDSPGGSALASDLIWHETQVIKKPIVASMGDVAASGGYYISMGAKKDIRRAEHHHRVHRRRGRSWP